MKLHPETMCNYRGSHKVSSKSKRKDGEMFRLEALMDEHAGIEPQKINGL